MKNLYLGDNPCRMKNLLHSSLSIITNPLFRRSPLPSFLCKLRFCRSQSSSLLRFSVSFGFAKANPPPFLRFSASFGFAKANPLPCFVSQ